MKTEIKQLWTRALRSHEFTQGTHFLEHSGSYCVNGILCVLSLAYGHTDYKTNNKIGVYGGEIFLPPEEVLQWAELTEAQAVKLAAMNDGTKNFEQLAEYIECNL